MSKCFEHLHEWLERTYRSIGVELASDQGDAIWSQVDSSCADLGDFQLGLLTRFVVLDDSNVAQEKFHKEVRWALESAAHFDYRTNVPVDQSDLLGAWNVQIVWIVKKECKEFWLESMRELRARSSHAEEIGLELIDLSCQSLEQALKEDGIPSLMFNVRLLLRRTRADIPAWISPDAEVETRLRALPESIVDREQRKFSANFLESSLSSSSIHVHHQEVVAPCIGPINIKNFRNIVDAEVLISTDDYASVIHGPNGTGKSSLFEAVCFALIGTSSRHHSYLEDKDLLQSARSNYISHVLKRLGSGDRDKPTVTAGQNEILSTVDSDLENVRQRLVAGRGNVLAQESAREFLAMNAAELASYVLGDYSPLARRIQAQVEDGAQSSRKEWQDWLRHYGLNASISKADTVLRRLVEKVLQLQVPPESQGPLVWLRSVGEVFPEYLERTRDVRAQWEDLDSASARESLVEQAALAVERFGTADRPISGWLTERSLVSAKIIQIIEEVGHDVDSLREEWSSIKDDLKRFRVWLSSPSSTSAVDATTESEELSTRIGEIRARLAELAPIGQRLGARKDHLSSIAASFISTWEQVHPHVCPTCDAQHERVISDVIAASLATATAEYEKIRSEYKTLQQEEAEIRLQMPVEGAPCPLSTERQDQLSKILRVGSDGPDSLESLARSAEASDAILSKFERVFALPTWKSPSSEDVIASDSAEIAARILELRAEGATKQELPNLWDHLKRSVDGIALEVVEGHLPKTIGAVWREISLVLTPAYWVQACVPKMTMELRRGAEKLGVTVSSGDQSSEIPARHVLNQAEQHVLGLAWFFTRFLTHGRFTIPFVALDDPAQEMDQVTFRKFARFAQSFQRLHRFLDAKFGILVLLHQEERAIEFARMIAPNGMLTVIEWSPTIRASGPHSTVRKVQLRNPEQRARNYRSPGTKADALLG